MTNNDNLPFFFFFLSDPTKPVQLQAVTPIAERFHSVAWPQLTQRNREPYLEISMQNFINRKINNFTVTMIVFYLVNFSNFQII